MDEKHLFTEIGLDIENTFLTIYTDVILHNVQFKSQESREVTTIDYFVKLKGEIFGAICYFMIVDSILYAVVDLYNVLSRNDHFKKIEFSGQKQLKSLKNLYF